MVSYDDYDYEIMKKTIYGQARGEPVSAQQAVAHVILNRAQANRSQWGGRKIADVCLQRYQFGCWNNGDFEVREWDKFASIDRWLEDVLNGDILDITRGCNHFINPKMGIPAWVNNLTKVISIGNYTFYRE